METLDWKKKIIIIIIKRIVGLLDFGIWGGMLGDNFNKKKKKRRRKRIRDCLLLSENKIK